MALGWVNKVALDNSHLALISIRLLLSVVLTIYPSMKCNLQLKSQLFWSIKEKELLRKLPIINTIFCRISDYEMLILRNTSFHSLSQMDLRKSFFKNVHFHALFGHSIFATLFTISRGMP